MAKPKCQVKAQGVNNDEYRSSDPKIMTNGRAQMPNEVQAPFNDKCQIVVRPFRVVPPHCTRLKPRTTLCVATPSIIVVRPFRVVACMHEAKASQYIVRPCPRPWESRHYIFAKQDKTS